MKDRIKLVCGDYGNIEELENIGNDPNFVFLKDPNFEPKTLFNENGDVINVNSWLECANYVNGGWISDKVDLINGEKTLFFALLVVTISYYFITNIISKKVKY